MNIKSLLLGSAAALAAVSGAQAADAIVAAEPEPMEYVRVCDAFGTGYFYIPGTETCLKIGGYVRFEMQIGQTGPIGTYNSAVGGRGVFPNTNARDDYWDATGRAQIDVTAKSDTELGTLTSVASLRWDYGNNSSWTAGSDSTAYINEAYIQLGGFKIGRYLNWWDKGINGETDTLASTVTTRMNSVSYTYTGDVFSVGIQADELSRAVGAGGALVGNQGVGLEGLVTAKFGAVAFDLLGGYDFNAEEGAIRALVSAPVGPGTLQAALVWSSGLSNKVKALGSNAYYDRGEWALAASYAFKATDKFTITPGAEYIWNTNNKTNGDWTGRDSWRAGLTLDYAIVSGLNLKTTVNYNESNTGLNTANTKSKYWDGFIRLDRTF